MLEPAPVLDWQPMDTFPKDGTRCDIQFQNRVVGKGFYWGQEPMGKNYCIRGDQNKMSPYLEPQGWRKAQ